MGASCDPSLQRINHHLCSWQWGTGGRRGSETGVQSLSDTSHFGITSRNKVIISSLSQSRGLPFSLAGIMRSVGGGVGMCENKPHQEATHTRFLYIFIQVNERKRDDKKRSKYRFTPLEALSSSYLMLIGWLKKVVWIIQFVKLELYVDVHQINHN